jgi:hypothetical protein
MLKLENKDFQSANSAAVHIKIVYATPLRGLAVGKPGAEAHEFQQILLTRKKRYWRNGLDVLEWSSCRW